MLATLAATAPAASQPRGSDAKVIRKQALSEPFDGMEATMVEVTIPPGPGSPAHRHSGFVLGYVLEGEFRFGVKGGPETVLKAGDTFYEPPDAVHTTSASARPDKPARILAVIVGPKGKAITTYE